MRTLLRRPRERCWRCGLVIEQSSNGVWRATGGGWFPGVCQQETYTRHDPLTRAQVIRDLVRVAFS